MILVLAELLVQLHDAWMWSFIRVCVKILDGFGLYRDIHVATLKTT